MSSKSPECKQISKLVYLFSRYLYLLGEVFISKVSIQSVLVMNLEEDKRSIRVWLLHLTIREDMETRRYRSNPPSWSFFSVHSTEVMCQAKIVLFVVNRRL